MKIFKDIMKAMLGICIVLIGLITISTLAVTVHNLSGEGSFNTFAVDTAKAFFIMCFTILGALSALGLIYIGLKLTKTV